MSEVLPQFRLQFSGAADDAAIVTFHNARFTVLFDDVIRLEYDDKGQFEDAPSQVFWYRKQAVPQFTQTVNGDTLTIETADLKLTYTASTSGFSAHAFTAENLSIILKNSDTRWNFGMTDEENLRGTARTLDDVSGQLKLDPGLLSRSGWAVIDDQQTLVFREDGWLRLRDRRDEKQDLYFFGYGTDYQRCLDEYVALTGATAMLPRYALGNWWSRYWRYSEDDLVNLMNDFKAYDIPLSVCVIDMDWHLTEVDPEDVSWASGWTGYTWNRELFPKPERLMQFFKDNHLRTSLNLHPHAGVQPHEEQYADMAHAMDVDPASRQPVKFDIADPRYTANYFQRLHHPHEAIGVDFWWIDWQQGEATKLDGLDPLWWLNHLHFYDLARDGNKRPFIFSRWGGYGNHRYPIGFSGDTHVTWQSLAFQPYFTATAANVGYGWWSHDIGGHCKGYEEPELYTRWVQYGVFSPILRLHSTNNPFLDRRPWGWNDTETLVNTRDAMQLRHALIPYIYTYSWRNAHENVQLIRPMYHDYPERDEAYACPDQYTFGDELIAAPFIRPADQDTRLSRQPVWLPDGDWYDFFNGRHFKGDQWHTAYGSLSEIPVFARAGAIVPMDARRGWADVENPEGLDVRIFAGADGKFTLYEDDGVSNDYQNGDYVLTRFSQQWADNRLTFTIDAADGNAELIPSERDYRLQFYGVSSADVSVTRNGDDLPYSTNYDADSEILTVELHGLDVTQSVVVTLTADALLSRRDRTYETVLRMIKQFHLHSNAKAAISYHVDTYQDDPAGLVPYLLDLTQSQRRALIETLYGVGVHVVREIMAETLIVMWNNDERDATQYHFSYIDPAVWNYQTRNFGETNAIPRFKTISPPNLRGHNDFEKSEWEFRATFFGQAVVTATRQGGE